MGTAARMGPGYFPRALGWLLIILGAAQLVRGLRVPGEGIPRWFFKPLIIVLLSVVVFGLIIPVLAWHLHGAARRGGEFRERRVPTERGGDLRVLLAITCVVVFVYALHLTMPDVAGILRGLAMDLFPPRPRLRRRVHADQPAVRVHRLRCSAR